VISRSFVGKSTFNVLGFLVGRGRRLDRLQHHERPLGELQWPRSVSLGEMRWLVVASMTESQTTLHVKGKKKKAQDFPFHCSHASYLLERIPLVRLLGPRLADDVAQLGRKQRLHPFPGSTLVEMDVQSGPF